MESRDIAQINELAIALTQEQLDFMDLKISLDFITPAHALAIEQTRGKVLDWIGWFKENHDQITNRFTISVSSNGRPPMTIGAAVFSYDMHDQVVNIHMVEHFKGIAYEDPLVKRMGFVALNVALVFANFVQATLIRVINPLDGAIPYYKYLSFAHAEEGIMAATLDSIKQKLAHLSAHNGQHDYEWIDGA